MPAKARTVLFTKEKDTKNTVKFTEVPTDGQAPVVGSLYLQRWFAGASNDVKLTIEVK